MVYRTLISAEELNKHLGDPDWAIVDCRFSLADASLGRQQYLRAHIPGAVYAHLNDDLCSTIIPGITGRHPLPELAHSVEMVSTWGISAGVQVVAYDDWPGASGGIAARLWWMLNWLGHEAVAVLDGGWAHWQETGYPTQPGDEIRLHRQFQALLNDQILASSQDVDRARLDHNWRVFDSRSADRFRGENETIDPIAGHIPGAISAPYPENSDARGFFRTPEALRMRFESLLDETPSNQAIFYCGSGVTAAHNVLAMAHAGLGMGRLYVGSWSEWITDPARPIER